MGEQLPHEERTEDRPHQEGRRQPERLGEPDAPAPAGALVAAPNRMPPAKAATNPFPPIGDRSQVGEQREGEDGDLLGHVGGPSTVLGERDQPPAEISDDDRRDDRQADLLERLEPPPVITEILLGRDNRDEEGDERRGDAVVETALDVERPANPRRHRPVRDDRHSERRVGGRQDGGDQRGRRPAGLGKHQVGQQAADDDRQRQPDEQQPRGRLRVALDVAQPHGRGIGEQQQGQCQLGDGQDRLVGPPSAGEHSSPRDPGPRLPRRRPSGR